MTGTPTTDVTNDFYLTTTVTGTDEKITVWAKAGTNVETADLAFLFDPTTATYVSTTSPMSGWTFFGGTDGTASGAGNASGADNNAGTASATPAGAATDAVLVVFDVTLLGGATVASGSVTLVDYTDITNPTGNSIGTAGPYALACFASGTRIATDTGDVAVEHLAIGDHVVLATGGTRPITWIGRRHVDIARHPRPADVLPIRVRAGAFAPAMPARDLLLSPDHAVSVGGVLVSVRHLQNDTTIRQQSCSHMTYWHVELAAHDVILAEGLPSESYLDTGDRGAFENATDPMMLHPRFGAERTTGAPCGQRVSQGAKLEEIRAALNERAKALPADESARHFQKAG